MIKVFKCDFCKHFSQDAEEMRIHEIKCSFNPANKKCLTCKNAIDVGFDYPIINCLKNLSTYEGEEYGNCIGWEAE